MRRRTVGLTVFLALAAAFWPDGARACDPWIPDEHTVDPAQVGVDQTPPQLAQPTVTNLQTNDTGSTCIGSPKCGWEHSATLTNLATDDVTPVDEIGYRVTLLSGPAPGPIPGRTGTVTGFHDQLTLLWDGGDDFDYTIQLVAVDAAGNESEPRTVRITDGNGGCNIGHRAARGGLALAIVALALASAVARPLR